MVQWVCTVQCKKSAMCKMCVFVCVRKHTSGINEHKRYTVYYYALLPHMSIFMLASWHSA